MFICNKCVDKYYKGLSINNSFGKCEICGTKGDCHDVHHSFLNDYSAIKRDALTGTPINTSLDKQS
jgi:hypothetical protein